MQFGRLSIRRLSIVRPLALLSLAMWIVGCSSSLIQPSGASADEVEELKRRIVDLQKRATVGEVEVARLEREVARLEDELAKARLEAAAQPAPETIETSQQIATYGEPEIEESDLEEPSIGEENLQQEPASSPPPPAPAVAETASSPTVAPPSPAPANAISKAAQSLYDEGYTLFHQQSYEEAESRFQRYVDLYPATELADNAQFWVGESRYARGEYSTALAAFSATVEQFPNGNKVADALFKAGRCLESLGELDQARATYREVDSRYPGTAASAQSRERLATLP